MIQRLTARPHVFYTTLLALIVVLFVAMVQNIFAQGASPAPSPGTAEVGGVTFPIPELGGCADLNSCTSYCDDPVNHTACEDYAKKKGFYEPDKVQSADSELFDDAQAALSCNSSESCFTFCSDPANHQRCDAFAKEQDVIGGYIDQPDKPEYLRIAQEVLGCNTLTSCSNFCDDTANASACNAFAHQVGLLGGQVQEGPGGCTSGATCQSFCSDPNNFATCQAYAPSGGTFQGPGGCTSQTDCRSFCEKNPDQCRSYAPGTSGNYVPVACPTGDYFGPGGVCTAIKDSHEAAQCAGSSQYWNGNSCQKQFPEGIVPVTSSAYFGSRPDMGNCTTPAGCYDYCSTNTGSCPGFNSSYPRPDENYVPTIYATPGTPVKYDPHPEMGNCASPGGCYDYCKENPGKCEGFNSNAPRPVDTYIPGTYYTPPTNFIYPTPPITNYYVTPVYYTPPAGSNYTTPAYYTPGIYSTPSYYTPFAGSNYTTPTYYTPGAPYYTPSGEYPTPTYPTPQYYTPPAGISYTTPNYYTPAAYTTPHYYTPPLGSTYTTPTYYTPPAYTTPVYYTPYTGVNYTTPVYYTPPPYNTPYYYTPPEGSTYTTPSYITPPTYTTPTYYTPGSYPTPTYYTPYYSYPTPGSGYSYPTPYTTPSYPTPGSYSYPTPGSYYYPTPTSGTYGTPTGYGYPTPGSYSYPTPGSYSYPTPGSYSYPTPGMYYTPSGYSYPSPSYGTPTYGTPSYGTPSYGTPTYETPSYGTPTYETPSYGTPSYGTPSEGGTYGASTQINWAEYIWYRLTGKLP